MLRRMEKFLNKKFGMEMKEERASLQKEAERNYKLKEEEIKTKRENQEKILDKLFKDDPQIFTVNSEKIKGRFIICGNELEKGKFCKEKIDLAKQFCFHGAYKMNIDLQDEINIFTWMKDINIGQKFGCPKCAKPFTLNC